MKAVATDDAHSSNTAGRAAQRYAARIVLGTAIVGGFFGAVVMARTQPFQVCVLVCVCTSDKR